MRTQYRMRWKDRYGWPLDWRVFDGLDRATAKAKFVEFVDGIPDRMAALQELADRTPQAKGWRADFSRESFVRLFDWVPAVRRLKRLSEAEVDAEFMEYLDRLPISRASKLRSLRDPERREEYSWDLTLESAAISFDLGIYFTECIRFHRPDIWVWRPVLPPMGGWDQNRPMLGAFGDPRSAPPYCGPLGGQVMCAGLPNETQNWPRERVIAGMDSWLATWKGKNARPERPTVVQKKFLANREKELVKHVPPYPGGDPMLRKIGIEWPPRDGNQGKPTTKRAGRPRGKRAK